MRAIDRVNAIDATLVSAPTGHAVSERDFVLGVGRFYGRLPIVQVRQEGLLREGVVEDARLLRNIGEDRVDFTFARIPECGVHVGLLVLEARVDVLEERVAALPRLDERRAALGRERLGVEREARQADLEPVPASRAFLVTLRSRGHDASTVSKSRQRCPRSVDTASMWRRPGSRN